VVCLIALSCSSAARQSFKIKEHLPSSISFFAAGAFEGTMDHLHFHYDGNHQFWQPDISWKLGNQKSQQRHFVSKSLPKQYTGAGMIILFYPHRKQYCLYTKAFVLNQEVQDTLCSQTG